MNKEMALGLLEDIVFLHFETNMTVKEIVEEVKSKEECKVD